MSQTHGKSQGKHKLLTVGQQCDEQEPNDSSTKAELVMKNGEDDRQLLQKRAPSRVKKYTVIDLVKSKRLLLTSLIIWFAW